MKKKQVVYTGRPRIRKGDTVVVIAGKDRGATGKVLRVVPAKGRIVIEGVNLVKRATRPNPQKNIKGGIVEREAPISWSNVQLRDPEKGKPTRVSVTRKGGERVRIAKKSGTAIGAEAGESR